MRVLEKNEIESISGGGTGEDSFIMICWQSFGDAVMDAIRVVTSWVYTPPPSDGTDAPGMGTRN